MVGSKTRRIRLGVLIAIALTTGPSGPAQIVQIAGVPFMATQVITQTTPAGTTQTQGRVARDHYGSTYVEEIDAASGAPRRAFIFDVPGKRLITLDLARHSFRIQAAPQLTAQGVPLGWAGDQLRWAEAHQDRSTREVQGSVAATQTWLGVRQVSGLVTVGTLRERRPIKADGGLGEQAVEVAESWFSVELGMSVLMTDTKPSAGAVTEVRLTGVMRAEPDASLFEVPREFQPERTKKGGQPVPATEDDQSESS